MAEDNVVYDGSKKEDSLKRTLSLNERINKVIDDQNSKIKDQGSFLDGIVGYTDNIDKANEAIADHLKKGTPLTEDMVKALEDGAGASDELGDAIGEIAPGLVGAAKGAQTMATAMSTALGPFGLIVAGAIILYKVISGAAKAVRGFQKETGLSAINATKLAAQFKIMAMANADLEEDSLKAAFVAARTELGATVDESFALSDNIARAAAQTGQTEDQFTKVLSAMETVSDMSREQLINQMKTNALLIETEGLAPTDVFADMASDTELMAKFTKDSGKNFQDAAIKAKKLGMSVATTAKSASSLLDFESSIEKQMEASLLLGRQINLDKARQLAFDDDLSGLQDEILKQVGGQAEFAGLRSVQKQALADAVGVDIAELSKLVKGNEAAAGEGSVATAGNEAEQLKGIHGEMVEANKNRVTKQSMKDLYADD